jgi:hypothetical protein
MPAGRPGGRPAGIPPLPAYAMAFFTAGRRSA